MTRSLLPALSTSLVGTHDSLRELQAQIPHHALLAPRVSASAIGWHIEHVALTVDVFLKGLGRTDQGPYHPRPDPRKLLALWIGWIPRGAVQSPASVRPSAPPDEQALLEHVERTESALGHLPSIPAEAWVKHPVLGPLRRDAVARFIDVHTRHHLKIVRDIRASI